MTAPGKRLIVGLFATGLLAGPAAAKNDKIIRDHYVNSYTGIDVCGLIVDVEQEGTFRATIHEWVIGPVEPTDPPANDFWIGTINDHGSETHTNPANGKSVEVSWVNNIKETSMVDIGDGYWEYTRSINGIPIRLGNKLLKDRGHIDLTTTLYLGDLSTVEDDAFVGEVVNAMAGPHPAYNTDAFCQAYVAALS